MSKYNLIDIFEQYKIGSGWTNDFDYDGMLNTGLGTSIDTPIEVLKKIFEDFTDVNYHREAEHLHYAIEAIEIGDMFEAQGKISDFHAEIKKTQGEQGMDMSDDLGAYMASKMEENEAVDLAIEASQEKAGIEVDESFKSLAKKLDKQKGIDKDEAAKIAGSIAAKKAAGAGKGPTAKQKKRMNEVRIDREVAGRIEGMLNIPMKAQFLDVFEDLWLDLIEDEPFYAEDVIAHLSNEMSKQINNRQAQGDRLAGMEESDAVNFNMKADADYDEGLEDIEEALPKFKGVPPMKDIVLALIKDAKGTNPEIESYVKSLKQSGDEFDDVDDYVEDFKNYVADKSLQEHFGRFMKDYQ